MLLCVYVVLLVCLFALLYVDYTLCRVPVRVVIGTLASNQIAKTFAYTSITFFSLLLLISIYVANMLKI